ncbi:tripartite tricarboxylate transporter substrate binding protein [Pigmentiphaga sp. YJ18]|uniref:Bug family tripartite tricarboxylate transporter substrate binding protein n=1 Tax=Pigmentiphaga sp. YJ18 TaxID=3134907 RepID=UPI00310E490D
MKFLAFAGLLAGTMATTPGAAADASNYPERPIRVVVNYAPGGSSDSLARAALADLEPILGQGVIVDNRPGANGNIGTGFVAKSPPDGYTLGVSGLSGVTNSFLYRNQSYDFFKDLVPVAMIARNPGVLIVNKSLPIRTAQELVQYAKAHPGKLNFASGGRGSSLHLNGEIFKSAAGVDIVHVPYRGEAPALNDLVGGQVQMMFAVLASAKPFIDQGLVRALAVTSPERTDLMPSLPTLRESGIGFGLYSWAAIFAPASTPRPILEKLNVSIRKAIAQPKTTERLREMGAETVDMDLAQIKAYTDQEQRFWSDVFSRLHVQMD